VFLIRTFKSRDTERLFERFCPRRFPADIHRAAFRKLRMLNRAQALQDLTVPPSNRLEALKGDRKGQYSVRVNDQWRICFRWERGDVYEVELVDYH